MKLPQVAWATVGVAALAAAACNRPDASDNVRVAAAEVKDVTERAREKLADSWLATKIQAQYFVDDDVKARNIFVTARDGVVTLRGRVDTPSAHEEAVQIARNTDGVLTVNDQLGLDKGEGGRWKGEGGRWTGTGEGGLGTVEGGAGQGASRRSTETVATTGVARGAGAPVAERLNDSGVTASIQSKYFLDNNLKVRRIAVDTRQGVVTLRGEVANDNERAQALILARTTEGVQRVEDGLTVNLAAQSAPAARATATAPSLPQAPPAAAPAQTQEAALATQLELKFAEDRQIKGAAIDVSVKDGVVLLEGTVPTAAARQRALSLARETKGVLQVVDRVKVGRTR